MKKSYKERVGILTFYHDNYNFGGLLQAYALPKILKERLGIEAEQIDYALAITDKHFVPPKKEKRNGIGFCYGIIYQMGIRFFSAVYKNLIHQRKKSFEAFMEEIPHSDVTYTFNSIQNNILPYHVIICGGDQIWNPELVNEHIKIYTLQFAASKIKKIAYSPSISVKEFTPRDEQIMRTGLNSLNYISVRERNTIHVLQEFTKQNIQVVVDPVLLMTSGEWKREVKSVEKHINKKEKYVLCYLLGDSVEQRKAIKRLAKNFNLKILTFPHIYCNVVRKCDLFWGNIHDFSAGPREFVGLIQNAEYVITDSFHACVFSMIFETPFAVFERNKIGEKGNMNSRIYDFLEEYHLENQLVTEKDIADMKEIPRIDYTYAHAHWEKRREESLEYLANALKDN